MTDPTMTPEQAVAIFAQLVNQTPAVPAQVDVFREAVHVLADLVNQSNAAARALGDGVSSPAPEPG